MAKIHAYIKNGRWHVFPEGDIEIVSVECEESASSSSSSYTSSSLSSSSYDSSSSSSCDDCCHCTGYGLIVDVDGSSIGFVTQGDAFLICEGGD